MRKSSPLAYTNISVELSKEIKGGKQEEEKFESRFFGMSILFNLNKIKIF